MEKEPEERKEEQPERVQKQRRASRQALWARRGLPQNTHQKVPFRLQGVCVCVYRCTHMHMCARTHTHTHTQLGHLGRCGEGQGKADRAGVCPHL